MKSQTENINQKTYISMLSTSAKILSVCVCVLPNDLKIVDNEIRSNEP